MPVLGGTVSWSLLPETTPGSHCGDLEYTYINEYGTPGFHCGDLEYTYLNEYGRITSVRPCQICLVKKDLAQREKVYQRRFL